MTFLIDGKQYIAFAGGPQAQAGAGGRGGAGAQTPAAPARPSQLIVLALDGTGKLPY